MEWLLLASILSLLTGMICISIAERKGYTKAQLGVWFAVGFFLNIIGIIITLVSPKKAGKLIQQGKMQMCPFCRELIRSEAILCKHCHSALELKQEET
jgi:hypothetical protein